MLCYARQVDQHVFGVSIFRVGIVQTRPKRSTRSHPSDE
jgi:hypothetical protein